MSEQLPKFEHGSRKGALKFTHRIAVCKAVKVLAQQVKFYKRTMDQVGPKEALKRDVASMHYCQKLLERAAHDPEVEPTPPVVSAQHHEGEVGERKLCGHGWLYNVIGCPICAKAAPEPKAGDESGPGSVHLQYLIYLITSGRIGPAQHYAEQLKSK